MNKIKQRISDCLEGKEDIPMLPFLQLQQIVPDLIADGQKNDADAILYATKHEGLIYVLLLVGKSLIQGLELTDYLERYFSDAKGLDYHIKKLTEAIYEKISGKDEAPLVLRDKSNHRWRSFNPLVSFDQVPSES